MDFFGLQGMLVYHSVQHLQIYAVFFLLGEMLKSSVVQALEALELSIFTIWAAKSSMFISKRTTDYRWHQLCTAGADSVAQDGR